MRPYAHSVASPAQNLATIPHHDSPMPHTSPVTASPSSWVPYMPVQPVQSHSTPVNRFQHVSHTPYYTPPSTSRIPYAPPPQYTSPPPQFRYSHPLDHTPMHEGYNSPLCQPPNGGYLFTPPSNTYHLNPAFNTALNPMPLYAHRAPYDPLRNPASRPSYNYGAIAPHPPHTSAPPPSMFTETPLWHDNSIAGPEDGRVYNTNFVTPYNTLYDNSI